MGETPSSCFQWLNGRVISDGWGWTAGRRPKLGALRTFKMAGATKAWHSVVSVEF